MFTLLAILEFIIVPYSLFTKKIKLKYYVLFLNVATTILLFLIYPRFAGGGGFGDMVVFLTAIIILIISFVQYIVVSIQVNILNK